MFRHLLLLVILVSPFFSKAGIEPYFKGEIKTPLSGPVVDISTSTSFAEAILNPSSSGSHIDLFKHGIITFGVDHHYGTTFASSRIEIEVLVKRFSIYNGLNDLPDTTITLAVSYSPNDSLNFEDRQSISFYNIEKYSAQITGIKVDGVTQSVLPANLYVNCDLFVDRIYDFTTASALTPSINPYATADRDCDLTTDELLLSWPIIEGAEEYQVEWTFINDYADGSGYIPAGSLSVDFRNNSTRVSTTKNNYTLTLAFDHGYICYRIRAIGRSTADISKRIFTEWSTPGDVISVSGATSYHNTVAYEVGKNWQYSATYAEEAKKKEVISFFDGSLRNRQMVTKINSDNNTIVGETIYDHQGRPAVQVLPVPVNDPSCVAPGASNSLKYYPNFNRNINGDPYSRNDFDKSDESDSCDITIGSMDSLTSGAANYYSENNPDLNGSQGYLPDAENYPFSQVEYTPDNTGRIRRQGGVGKQFQLGSGHESKFYYSHPFQEQLNMMFGSEVGDAAHYQKNMVIDPNGQVSVSYLDQEGRVIATSLAGEVPPNLIGLPSAAEAAKAFNVDLLAKDANEVSASNKKDNIAHSIVFGQTMSLSSSSNVVIDYELSIRPFIDECLPDICMSCVYDLSIEFRDDCGILLSDSMMLDSLTGHFDVVDDTVRFLLDCPFPALYEYNYSDTLLNVSAGSYQLTKTLTVNEDAYNYYLSQFLDSSKNECFKTLWEFQNEYLADIDFSDCNTEASCEACVQALGTLEDFIANNYGTQATYEAAVEECRLPCEAPSFCMTQKQLMMSDMRPGGQYGEYELSNGSISPESFQLSILNEVNNRLTISPSSSGTSYATWRKPQFISEAGTSFEYRDADMVTRSHVPFSVFEIDVDGITVLTTSPEMTAPVLGVNVFYDAETELYYTYPELLKNVSDFIVNFDPAWGNSLLVYHPEYSFYKTCLEFVYPVHEGDAFTSESFDQKMLSVDTWAEAVTAGFIKTGYASFPNVNDRITDYTSTSNAVYDPFLFNPGTYGTYGAALNARILNYKVIDGVTYSMMQLAATMTRCGTSLLGTIPGASCARFGDNSTTISMTDAEVRNAEWISFRSIYLSEKQRLQYELSKNRSIADPSYYGYNKCIQNTSFNPFENNFLFFAGFPFSPFFSQYMNIVSQPCNFQQASLFKYKKIRFTIPSDIYQPDPEYVAYQQFIMTGQCPAASAFEMLLSEVADDDKLHLGSFPMNTLAYLGPLYIAISDFAPSSATPTVTWNQTMMTSDALNVTFSGTSGSLGSMELTGLSSGPAGITWADVLSFSSLQYTSVSFPVYNFTIVASVLTTSGIVTVNLNGKTTIPIGGCKFAEVCEKNQLGQEMEALLSAVASINVLDFSSGPGGIDLQDASNYVDVFVTPFIQQSASGHLTSSLYWEFDNAVPAFELYESSTSTRLELKIISSDPVFSLSGLNTIKSFGALTPLHGNMFELTCYDGLGNYLTTLKLDAIFYDNSDVEEVYFGDCDLPDPILCEGPDYQNLENVKQLLSVVFNASGIPSTIYSYQLLDDMLAQFPSDFEQAEVSADGNQVTVKLPGCDMVLSFDPDNNPSGINLSSLVEILDIIPTGEPNNYGTYSAFKVVALFTQFGVNTIEGELTGTTCIPLKPCKLCPEEKGEEEFAGRKRNDTAFLKEENSVRDYELYAQAIAALNKRMNWSESDAEFVRPMDYRVFFTEGVSYNIDAYLAFINGFNPETDDADFLTNHSRFIEGPAFPVEISPCQELYNQYVDSFLIYTDECHRDVQPLDYNDFLVHNLCCSENGQMILNFYYGELENIVDCLVPELGYSKDTCGTGGNTDCLRNWNALKKLITAFNRSEWAQYNHSYLATDYDNFEWFIQTGKCECIGEYLLYLAAYVDADSLDTMPLPKTLDEFCPPSVLPDPGNPCADAYGDHLDCVSRYNHWARETGQVSIEGIIRLEDFIAQKLCLCLDEYCAILNSIMNGTYGDGKKIILPDLTIICKETEQPCAPKTPIVDHGTLPEIEYTDPCAEFLTNIALANAQNAFEQQIQDFTTDFSIRYYTHCMSAFEDFHMQFNEKEYHRTLYYYDQAGNLIKTIPPEGVELLDIFSDNGSLNTKINQDRLAGTHQVISNHRMATKYLYNSLNQLVAQTMPDQDNLAVFEITLPNGLAKNLHTTAIQMVNENIGYLTGYLIPGGAFVPQGTRGYLYRTENGGQNWSRVYGTLGADLNEIGMVSTTIGFALGEYGLLLKTANAGVSWDLVDTYGSGIMSPFTALAVNTTLSPPQVLVSTNTGKLVRLDGTNYNTINLLSSIAVPLSAGTITEVTSMIYSSADAAYYISATMFNTATGSTGSVLKISSLVTTSSVIASVENVVGAKLSFVNYYGTQKGIAAGEDGNLVQLGEFPGFYQKMLVSGMKGNILSTYFLNDDRGIAQSTDGTNSNVYWTVDGGVTWELIDEDALQDYKLGFIRRTSTKLELVATGASTSKRIVLNSTGTIALIDQTPVTPTAVTFTAVTSLVDGSSIYYFGITSTGGVYVSNQQNSSAMNVTYTLLNTLSSFSAKKITAHKISGGYAITALSTTGEIRVLTNTTITGAYTLTALTAGVSSSFADFDVLNVSSTMTVVGYDNFNRQLYRKPLTLTPAAAMTALTSGTGINSWPVAGSIVSVANYNDSYLTLVGNDGRIFTTTPAGTATTIQITNRSAVRFTPISEIASNTNTGNSFVAAGSNGMLLKRNNSAPASDLPAGWYTVPMNALNDFNGIQSQGTLALIAGSDGFLQGYNLATSTVTNFITNLGQTISEALGSADLKSIATNGTVVYATGENGIILYSPNSSTSGFINLNTGTGVTNNCVRMIPSSTRALISADNGKIFRLNASSILDIKEIYNPQLTSVHFDQSGYGTVIGSHFYLRTTSDGGQTWKVNLPASTSDLSSFKDALKSVWTKRAVNGNHFAVVGGHNYLGGISAGVATTYSYTGDANDIQFRGNGTGFITAGGILNKLTLTSTGTSYTPSAAFIANTFGTINAMHIFDNQSVMVVGDGDMIQYLAPGSTTFTNANAGPFLTGSVSPGGDFTDVYFHDDVVGYITANSGYLYRVTSQSLHPVSHAIQSMSCEVRDLYDGIVTSTNSGDVQLTAIAFGSRYEGVLGGYFTGTAFDPETKPYVRWIKDQSGEFASNFFYDRLGRIVVSRNSRQELEGKYSYTLYDALGRVYEAGEKQENEVGDRQFAEIFGASVNGLFVASVIDDAKLAAWLNNDANLTRREVTRSYYDQTNTAIAAMLPTTFVPDELTQRKRIVHVTYEETYDGDEDTYDHATHYDYDIHGNVKTLIQDNKKMADFDVNLAAQRFKRMDYEYDLISGNVHRVDYQTGKTDQWHHAYAYDADNRITDVYTTISTPLVDPLYGVAAAQNEPEQNPLWDQEANYSYYAHGPLARILLGAEQVQGVDNVYTLQGWIKGVNSNTLDNTLDPGQDGNGLSDNHAVAMDAYAFSLHYFTGDYKGTVSGNTGFVADQASSDLTANSSDLYNGNIGRMVTTITDPDTREVLPLGNAYRYDQLNRLSISESFNNLDLVANTWGYGGSSMYHNSFSYDANGNITYQERRDEVNGQIDKMTYGYEKNTAGKLVSNRLYHIDDEVLSSTYSDDIDDMGTMATGANTNSTNNYKYDKEGRLTRDAQESIRNISWRVDGKVRSITRSSFSGKKNLTFDYDAMGRRVAKHVYNGASQLEKSTYYTLDAQGNTIGVYEYVVDIVNSSVDYYQAERHIYGSSRLGILNDKIYLFGSVNDTYSMSSVVHVTGKRSYELSNHLGNVLAVVSDKTIPHDNSGTVDYYMADIRQSTDYSPFGVTLRGRNFRLNDPVTGLDIDKNRNGYQGSEMDNELKGEGNSYTTEFRQLDPRLGRWLSIDPKMSAWESPYASMGNNPVKYSDVKGDTVTVDKTITENADYNKVYNAWASTKTGKKFLKEYGVGGKSEHISVVFTLDALDDTWGDTRGETRTRIVDRKTGVESYIPRLTEVKNADALLKGTDKNSYLKFTIALDNDQYVKGKFHKAIASNTFVHETQHMSIDLQTLKSNKMIASAYQHHEWMSKDSWYEERYDTFKELKWFWGEDYNTKWKDKRSEDGYIKDKINNYDW